jgi:hypothetical protein
VVPVLAAGVMAARKAPRAALLFASGLVTIAPAMLLLRFPFKLAFAQVAAHQLGGAVDTTAIGLLEHWALLVFLLPLREFVTQPICAPLLFGAIYVLIKSQERTIGAATAKASVLASIVYLLTFPFMTGLRLEFVFIPAAAFGLALTSELTVARATARVRQRLRPRVDDSSGNSALLHRAGGAL